MPSQFTAFQFMVARQMAGYQERIAQKIREQTAKHGEAPIDLAVALGTHVSTTERWLRGERTPQRRHRKQLAEHWKIPFEELEPDLMAEEKQIRAQLDRIEEMLRDVVEQLEGDLADQAVVDASTADDLAAEQTEERVHGVDR